MLHKSCPVQIKAVGEDADADTAEGQFEAIVSAFGNVDSYGDVVQPGAFTDTLSDWEKSGNPIPVYWSHRMDDPDYNIGYVLEAKETDQGLWIKAQVDMEQPKAGQVYRLLKGRRVTQFSFAYDVVDGGMETEDEESYYSLRKLKLYEVGPTPIGANQDTELLDVKAASRQAARMADAVKAGRVLSAKNETALRDARDAIDSVLSALDSDGDDQEKASGSGPAKDEEPQGAKSEEPNPNPSARNLATLSILSLTPGAERGSP